jgi:hypothetical protein
MIRKRTDSEEEYVAEIEPWSCRHLQYYLPPSLPILVKSTSSVDRIFNTIPRHTTFLQHTFIAVVAVWGGFSSPQEKFRCFFALALIPSFSTPLLTHTTNPSSPLPLNR